MADHRNRNVTPPNAPGAGRTRGFGAESAEQAGNAQVQPLLQINPRLIELPNEPEEHNQGQPHWQMPTRLIELPNDPRALLQGQHLLQLSPRRIQQPSEPRLNIQRPLVYVPNPIQFPSQTLLWVPNSKWTADLLGLSPSEFDQFVNYSLTQYHQMVLNQYRLSLSPNLQNSSSAHRLQLISNERHLQQLFLNQQSRQLNLAQSSIQQSLQLWGVSNDQGARPRISNEQRAQQLEVSHDTYGQQLRVSRNQCDQQLTTSSEQYAQRAALREPYSQQSTTSDRQYGQWLASNEQYAQQLRPPGIQYAQSWASNEQYALQPRVSAEQSSPQSLASNEQYTRRPRFSIAQSSQQLLASNEQYAHQTLASNNQGARPRVSKEQHAQQPSASNSQGARPRVSKEQHAKHLRASNEQNAQQPLASNNQGARPKEKYAQQPIRASNEQQSQQPRASNVQLAQQLRALNLQCISQQQQNNHEKPSPQLSTLQQMPFLGEQQLLRPRAQVHVNPHQEFEQDERRFNSPTNLENPPVRQLFPAEQRGIGEWSLPSEFRATQNDNLGACANPGYDASLPLSFRQFPIYPTEQEINSTSTKLEVQDGNFEDTEHYLSVQFKILKEEFVHPLRIAFKDIRRLRDPSEKADDILTLNIIDVTVAECLYSQKRTRYVVRVTTEFDYRKLKTVFKNQSHQESLLCFSRNGFKSIGYAWATEESKRLLEECRAIQAIFRSEDRDFVMKPTEVCQMLVVKVPHVGFLNNLRALRVMFDFPVLNSIINCDLTRIDLPQYLLELAGEHVEYDLSPLFTAFPTRFEAYQTFHSNEEHLITITEVEPILYRLKLPNSQTGPLEGGNQWTRHSDFHVDEYQFEAIKVALTRALAIIKGCPETGKIYTAKRIIQLLLNNSNFWNPTKTTPMLILTQTSQTLDHLLDSIAPLLSGNEIIILDEASNSQIFSEQTISKVRERSLENRGTSTKYIFANNDANLIENEIKSLEAEIQREFSNPSPLMERVLEQIAKLKILKADYDNKIDELEAFRETECLRIAQGARVVGATVQGAAQYNSLIRQLRAPIVFVFQANEIIEANLLAALSKDTKHLILFGDRRTSSANPVSCKLAESLGLKSTLFARLISKNVPLQDPELQHVRIRPCIMPLFASDINPLLKSFSHESSYPRIKELPFNLYFFTYEEPLSDAAAGTITSSEFESRFLIRLASYLIRLGHKSCELIALATFPEQCGRLENSRARLLPLNTIQITTINRYQGLENDIILVSLVACNINEVVGLLDRSNRGCVALSRGRMGFFCIGNIEALAAQNHVWMEIARNLTKMKAIGSKLTLCCPKHPFQIFEIGLELDFSLFPTSFCPVQCDHKYKICGHQCPRTCHVDDPDHVVAPCRVVCGKPSCKNHRCQKACWKCDGCEPCMEPSQKTLPCFHVVTVMCRDESKPISCGKCLGASLQPAPPSPVKAQKKKS